MFAILGVTDPLAVYRGWFGHTAPSPPAVLVFMYRCTRCDVTGRCESEGDARCWLCGGDEVIEFRTIVKDQASLSGGSWVDNMPEPCERLVERSA